MGVQVQPQGQKQQWLQIGWQRWLISAWTDAALHEIPSGQHHGALLDSAGRTEGSLQRATISVPSSCW